MGAVHDFRELRVYGAAFNAAQRIYSLTRHFPPEERYSLTDQIRRSSRSVCGNIAEAWRKRRYPASFTSKLSDADAEAAETTVWLDFAHSHQFISDDDYRDLRDKYDQVNRQLRLMMNNPDQWCGTQSKP